MKIAVAGIGYVGLSNAVLLAQNHDVIAIDIDDERIAKLNAKICPISDLELEDFIANKTLSLSATNDADAAFRDAELVIIATPTDYDAEKNVFDTSSVEDVLRSVISINKTATIVIKSTIPVGYTKSISKKIGTDQVIFSPEFLREGRALHDNLYPSRIVVGEQSARAEKFANMLLQGAIKKDITLLFTGSSEAEAIKLFANSYLAMRVAYMNELDSYAMIHGMNTKQIIDGIGLDPRIGQHYNNPSFGYGGYCLPKDTMQLRANFAETPQNIVSAIVEANQTRKNFIAAKIAETNPSTVGIYRLVMKTNSDNFRQSAIQDIIKNLNKLGINIVVYEPELKDISFDGCDVINDLITFKEKSDVIVANRISDEITDVIEKVFTRDVFKSD